MDARGKMWANRVKSDIGLKRHETVAPLAKFYVFAVKKKSIIRHCPETRREGKKQGHLQCAILLF